MECSHQMLPVVFYSCKYILKKKTMGKLGRVFFLFFIYRKWCLWPSFSRTVLDWKKNRDRTYSCLRDWRFSASWHAIEASWNHQSTIAFRGLRKALYCTPIMPRDSGLSDSRYHLFPVWFWNYFLLSPDFSFYLNRKIFILCSRKIFFFI